MDHVKIEILELLLQFVCVCVCVTSTNTEKLCLARSHCILVVLWQVVVFLLTWPLFSLLSHLARSPLLLYGASTQEGGQHRLQIVSNTMKIPTKQKNIFEKFQPVQKHK